MVERVKIHNRKRRIGHNVFELQREVKKAVEDWKEDGLNGIVKQFKKFVQEL